MTIVMNLRSAWERRHPDSVFVLGLLTLAVALVFMVTVYLATPETLYEMQGVAIVGGYVLLGLIGFMLVLAVTYGIYYALVSLAHVPVDYFRDRSRRASIVLMELAGLDTLKLAQRIEDTLAAATFEQRVQQAMATDAAAIAARPATAVQAANAAYDTVPMQVIPAVSAPVVFTAPPPPVTIGVEMDSARTIRLFSAGDLAVAGA